MHQVILCVQLSIREFKFYEQCIISIVEGFGKHRAKIDTPFY